MNVARSALNNFLKICGNVDINLYEEITRFMKGVFQSSPALPRYAETWDVNVVLEYLKSFNSQYFSPAAIIRNAKIWNIILLLAFF